MPTSPHPRTRPARKRPARAPRRSRHARPKTPAPKNGWRITELSALTGVSVRALRYYVSKDVLRPLEFRGTATRYPRSEVLRLLKMLELKSKTRGRVVLDQLMRDVDALLEPALETWVASQNLAPELARALGIEAKVDPSAAQLGGAAQGPVAFETWRHIPLLPGLELKLRADASPAVKSMAERLYAVVVASLGG